MAILSVLLIGASWQLRDAARIMRDQREQVAFWKASFVKMDREAHEALDVAHKADSQNDTLNQQANELVGLAHECARQRDSVLATAQQCMRYLRACRSGR